MTKKKYPARRIESIKYKDFRKVAENFADGAELAYEYGYYNAAGVLIIHAAIAYADSITIYLASKKIKGDSHYDIIALLNEVVPQNQKSNSALNHLKKLIDHKNLVSYSGEVYNKTDYEKLKKHFTRFSTWAKSLLE